MSTLCSAHIANWSSDPLTQRSSPSLACRDTHLRALWILFCSIGSVPVKAAAKEPDTGCSTAETT